MAEFKIRVGVELDASDLESKLRALDGDFKIEVQLDMDRVNSQLSELKNSFKNAFKIDGATLSDINKINKALGKIDNTSRAMGKSGGGASQLVNQYKDLYGVLERLQKQVSKGGLGEESLKRTQAQIGNVIQEMNRLRSEMSNAENASLDFFESKKSLNSLIDLNQYLNKIESQVASFGGKIQDIDMDFLSDSSKAELLDAMDALEKLKTAAKEDIRLEMEVGDALDQLTRVEEVIKRTQKEAADSAREYNRALAEQQKAQENLIKQQQKAQENLIKQQQRDALTQQREEASRLINEYKELGNLAASLERQLNGGNLTSGSISRLTAEIIELKSQMSSVRNEAEQLGNSLALDGMKAFDTSQMTRSLADMHSYMSKIESQSEKIRHAVGDIDMSNLSSGSKAELEEVLDIIERIQREAQDIDMNIDVSNSLSELRQCEDTVQRIQREARNASSGGIFGSIFGSSDDFFGNFSQFKLLEIAGDFIADGIRTTMRAWGDLIAGTDAAVTDLNKVYDTGLSGDNLKQYLNEVTEVAKSTGKSSIEVIQGTASAVQSGISNIDQALVYATQSAMLSNVGDISQDEANTMLASIMSAYGGVENSLKPVREQLQGAGKDYSTLTKFMDLANYAGNNYAVTTADVGEALRNSASALNETGVSMEQATGMAVAMNEILQDSSRSGNALKSISAGISGLSASAKDGTIQLTKSGMALKEIAGIDVWNQKTGEVKNMYEVMDELALKWDDLSEAERVALGTSIAGKTQLTAFSALLSNWDTAKRLVQEYKDGLTIGSAERENAAYVDSIAGKWNAVKENMASIGNTLVTSDMVKGFLDILQVTTDGLDSFTQAGSNLMSDIFDGNVGQSITNSLYGVLEGAFDNLNLGSFGDKLAATISDSLGFVADTLTGNADGALMTSLQNMLNNFGGFETIFGGLGDILDGTFGNLTDQLLSMTHFAKPLMMLRDIMDLTDFGGGRELQNQIDERRDNINAITGEINSLQNQKDAIESILPRYDELSKKTNRSKKENQELSQMRNQMAEMYPELVIGYNSSGDPILKSLTAQNTLLESQIKLKQQSQRIEENALASNVQQQRIDNQKKYNEAIKEYNEMQLTSDTKRKDGLFGEESLQDYAKRVIAENEKISKSNQEAYKQRLQDHQQYVADERAIQEKYINQMENNAGFKAMTENMQEGMVQFMDALDWSQFTDLDASKFTNELANLGDKFVSTTAEMGTHSKAIAELTNSYADGQTTLTEFTDGLTKQYEAAGKFDAESFTAWRQGLQNYVDTTGDLAGANAEIEKMAQSLNKITGIDTSTWQTALSFDPAPIDASNQALNRFLQSYGKTTETLGSDSVTDMLASQYQTLQSSYMQLTNDLANQRTIDVEYLLNMKINQPEPISALIDEIIADGTVEPREIEILMNAQAEILNTGTLSQETISQIAEEFNMTEAEVIAKLNVKTEVTETGEPVEEVKARWDALETAEKVLSLIQQASGGDILSAAKTIWDGLEIGEKIQSLIQQAMGGDLLSSAKAIWDGLSPGNILQTLIQNATGSGVLNAAKAIWDGLNVGEKIQSLIQKATGSDLLSSAKTVWDGLSPGNILQTLTQNATGTGVLSSAKAIWDGLNVGEKIQSLIQKATGKEEVQSASDAIQKLPSKKEVTVSIVQTGKNILESIGNWFKNLGGKNTQTVTVDAKVGKVDTSTVSNASTKPINVDAKVGKVDTSALSNASTKPINVDAKVGNVDTSALSNVSTTPINVDAKVGNVDTSALSSISTTPINVDAKVGNVDTSALSSISVEPINIDAKVGTVDTSAISSISVPPINIDANTSNALSQVNSLRTAIAGIQNKTVTVTVGGNALSQVNSIRTAITGIQSKSVTVTVSGNALGQINSIKSALAGIQSRNVTVTANVSGTPQVTALRTAISSLQGKSVTVSATVNGTPQVTALTAAINAVPNKTVTVTANVVGTAQVNALTAAINKVKSKSVTVSASVSGTGAVQGLASAIASVRSKRVSVSVSRTVTTSYKTASLALANAPIQAESSTSLLNTSMNMLSSMATSSDISPINVPVTMSDAPSLNVPVTASASSSDLSSFLNSLSNNVVDSSKSSIKELTDLLKELSKTTDELCNRDKSIYGNKLNNSIQNACSSLKEQEECVDDVCDSYEDLNEEIKQRDEEAERARKEAEDKAWQQFFDKINNSLQEMEYNLDKCKDKLDLLDAENERSQGQNKIDYLNERIQLLNEQLKVTQSSMNTVANAQSTLRDKLMGYGFAIDQSGSISNYDEILNMLIADEETYERAKKLADEYMSLVRGDMEDLKVESAELENEIKEMLDEIEKLEREMKLFSSELDLTILNQEFEELSNQLDIIDGKLEYAFGTDKVSLMREEIELLNKQLENQAQQLEATKEQLSIYQQDLNGYGFKIDADGNITNYKEIMELYQSSEDIEKLKDLTEEYFDLLKDFNDANVGFEDLKIAIKDAYKEQLEITQDMEKEITKLIEKEYDKRKKEIEDYTDKQIELLEDMKKSYNDLRKTQDYEKSVNEQTKEIAELQKRLETARKDNSIAGLKRQAEILKEIEEAQKELEETTQDRIDDNFEDNIDSEIDKLEKEQDQLIEALDKKFSEENIAKMVQEVLATGFIELNGEIQSVQDALIDSINNSAEGYSAMSGIIKNELIANLNVALDTMKQMSEISNNLGLNNYNSLPVATSVAVPLSENGSARNVSIGDTNITVQGSVDDVTLREIENLIKQSQNRMLSQITKNL